MSKIEHAPLGVKGGVWSSAAALNMHRRVSGFALAALLVTASCRSDAAAAPKAPEIRRTLLSRQDVDSAPALETQLWLIEYPPGAAAPTHRHPVVGIGYVIEGEYDSVFGEEPMAHVRAGQSFVDLAKVEHRLFRNPSKDKPLRMVVAYTIARGKAPVEF